MYTVLIVLGFLASFGIDVNQYCILLLLTVVEIVNLFGWWSLDVRVGIVYAFPRIKAFLCTARPAVTL